jgi:hypothetical protein
LSPDKLKNFTPQKLRREIMRAILCGAVHWSPQKNPLEGYTLIIGCNARLLPLAAANLALLDRQHRNNLHEIILVIDSPWTEALEQQVKTAIKPYQHLPLRVLYYTNAQGRRAKLSRTAWAYSWMSWSLGIAASQTRYVMLHDLDAMLIEPSILEHRYDTIRQRGDQYLGHRFYQAMGLYESDRVAATYELMFDAAYVRQHFKPIDLFNHVTVTEGRYIHYDTFLWAQHQHGSASILPIPEDDMVHPSQMICQFTELVDHGRQPARQPNLPMLPYFYYLGGEPQWLADWTRRLAETERPSLPLVGRELDLTPMTAAHAAWLRKQAYRLETTLVGQPRPEVVAYFDALERCVGALASEPSHSQHPVSSAS